ncbi:MAG TPA: AraC family transcriptional regulator, partial [Candidatus Mediterraneibacter intestinigallinarum]|nr:AraC family transcriptional regulator [Candidatus Mediterraneibacter intestinigallinarum]
EDIQYILGNCYTAETILEEFHFLIDEKFGRAVRGEKDKETLAREVKFFLDENYKRRISNQDLTEEFGFVSSYISSIFKTYYGKTPMDYVVECRMEEGKRLLRRGDMKIKAIADRLGYEDSLYFSKVFKKIEGMSPKQYMNKRDL